MKTAIEILKERTKDYTKYPTAVLTCNVMEEYAKQQAMEFAKWIELNSNILYHPVREIWTEWPKRYTTQQLYERFLTEQDQ